MTKTPSRKLSEVFVLIIPQVIPNSVSLALREVGSSSIP